MTNELKSLTATLRKQIARRALTRKAMKKAMERLKGQRHTYRVAKYPLLPVSVRAKIPKGNRVPTTLAELLLWKMGKWTAYRNFVAFFHSGKTAPASQSVVFDAFALHLKNRNYPIFDQHSLRAIWSITRLSKAERSHCNSFLVDAKGHWKESGTGKSGAECYELFKKQVTKLQRQSGTSLQEIDRLLMPLGQALGDFHHHPVNPQGLPRRPLADSVAISQTVLEDCGT